MNAASPRHDELVRPGGADRFVPGARCSMRQVRVEAALAAAAFVALRALTD